MKKINKIMLATIAISAIFALTAGTSLAMYGNGNGNGNGQGKSQGKVNQTYSGTQSQTHNPADLISNIEAQDLDETEIDLLMKQYEEETMANELYTYFYEKYGVQTFANIADSEAEHKDAIQALLDRYELETPTGYDHIQELYEELKTKGDLSLFDALEVGVSIEIVDIEDIITAIKLTDNDDIKTILVNIGGASYNHMKGFVQVLENNGLETDIDYSDYLSENDLSLKGGELKVRLAERLESEGVDIPENASSEAIKLNCENSGNNSGNQKNNKGQQVSSSVNKGQQGQIQSSYNSTLKNSYKKSFSEKYSSALKNVSDESLENIISKIDEALETINSGNYSIATKQKYNAMLYGLREVVEEETND